MVPATSRPAEQVSWLDVMAQCARAECPAIGMAQRAPATPPARNPRRGLLSTTPPSRESPRRPESPSTHPICRTHPTPRTTRSRDTRETLDSRQSCATAACSWVSGRATKEQAESCAMLDAAQRREAPPQAAWRRVGPPASPRPDPKIKFYQILFWEQILLMTCTHTKREKHSRIHAHAQDVCARALP